LFVKQSAQVTETAKRRNGGGARKTEGGEPEIMGDAPPMVGMGSAVGPSRRKLTPGIAGALRPSIARLWRSGLPAPPAVARPPAAVCAGPGRAGPADGGPQAARHRWRVPPRSTEHKRPPPPIGVPSNYPSASPLRCRGGVTSAPAGLLPGRIVSRPGGQVHFPSHRPFNWR